MCKCWQETVLRIRECRVSVKMEGTRQVREMGCTVSRKAQRSKMPL